MRRARGSPASATCTAGLGPGQFIAPHGLAVDSRGDIYVGEVSYTAWPRFGDGPPPKDLRSLRKLVRLTA